MIIEKVKRFRDMGVEAMLADSAASVAFGQLYDQLFGVKICISCRNIITDKFKKLTSLTSKDIKIMSSRKFNVVPGKLIDTSMASTGPIGQYTSDNMTDAIAIELLRYQKGWINWFVDPPKDWREIVTNTKKPAAPKHERAVDRSEAIRAEKEIEGNPSSEFLVKEAIRLVKALDNADVIEKFVKDEKTGKGERSTLWKAVRKRYSQLRSA